MANIRDAIEGCLAVLREAGEPAPLFATGD